MRGFIKKYFIYVCLALFFVSCKHDNEKTEAQILPPPSNLKAVATQNANELSLNWKQVPNNCGYEISYKNIRNNETKFHSLEKDVNTFLLMGLEGGTQYEISCKTKGNGRKFLDSLYSLVARAIPKTESTKLSPPKSFTAIATGKTGEVNLEWEAVQYATSYIVSYKKTNSTDSKTTQNVENDKVSCLILSLENNVEYSFFIMAKGDGITWIDSNEVPK